jgi:protein Tex
MLTLGLAMQSLHPLLAQELNLQLHQVESALALLEEGATVPFIARYRKERTGAMDEIQLRNLFDRYGYLTELADRKTTILASIEGQGKLTDELRQRIESSLSKTDLEDLYLPYRPKRRTKATIAREKGLAPLADWIESQNQSKSTIQDLSPEARRYINAEAGVKSVAEALQGASDILAEAVAERAEIRAYLRDLFLKQGQFVTKISEKKHPEGTTKFELYRNYQAKVSTIAPHNLLAIYRGETEGIVQCELTFDADRVQTYLLAQVLRNQSIVLRNFYQSMVQDAFDRLIKPSLTTEVRAEKKQQADIVSIQTFESNLRELLLSAPAGMKPTLAIDPGFRTGCKVAVLDRTGKFLQYQTIFPHTGADKRITAQADLKRLIDKHQVELIAIGNGTAGRETDEFTAEVIANLPNQPIKVMVNESGASIYSASDVAIAEFPDLDLTVRGAISIGRRLQDPLAELVKLDPKSIGVGQYQHDVDQKLLRKKLDETVESCVNFVGVDLNTASKELLTFVSGITPTIAQNIVAYRNENGAFKNRKSLLKVAKLGPKSYEQAAGFLRIRSGENPLDNTAVHPERYPLVQQVAKDAKVDLSQTPAIAAALKQNLRSYISESIGELTLRDMIAELEKPGRDPRAEFKYATFRSDIKEITDLLVGMQLEGTVTNVANFGAFVDIGVHQDGLVHVSQMADRFISNPNEIVKVGQVVQVQVMEVNVALKRIGLTMKLNQDSRSAPAGSRDQSKPSQPKPSQPKPAQPKANTKPPEPSATIADLQAKFGRKR